MSLYYLRHGKTDWNAKNVMQGRIDIPLNDEGREEARKAKETLDQIPLALVIVSPLLRTQETAAILLEGRNVETRLDERILEQYFGDYEGLSREEKAYAEQKKKHFCRYPGGEGFLDCVYRVYSLLHELEDSVGDQNVLLVAHGGISRIVHSYFFDMEDEEFETHFMPNCGIVRYEWPHRRFPARQLPSKGE
ncbi:MAG: histidine phosphatase family protein [Candidatus Enteromonas sp.]